MTVLGETPVMERTAVRRGSTWRRLLSHGRGQHKHYAPARPRLPEHAGAIRTRDRIDLPFVVAQHTAPMVWEARRANDRELADLELAVARLDGLTLLPGQSFSFNRAVGRHAQGKAISQVANVVHWMALHSELTVLDRSADPIDLPLGEGVDVPWGVGCYVSPNSVDLVLRNDSDVAFQLQLRVGRKHLKAELRADAEPEWLYEIVARNEGTDHEGESLVRFNEIWRRVIDPLTLWPIREEMVRANRVLVPANRLTPAA